MLARRPDRHEHRRRLAGWTFATQTGNPVVRSVGSAGPRNARRRPGERRARRPERARRARAGAHAARMTGSVRCGSRVAWSSRADCGCGGRASSSRGRCSSTVAAKSSPARAPGAGCGRSRSGTCAAGCSRLARRGAAARAPALRRLDARAARAARPAPHPGPHRATSAPCARSLPGRRQPRRPAARARDAPAAARRRGARSAITTRQRWRCVRDRKGEFTGIRPVKPTAPTARPGLAVRMGAPRVLGVRGAARPSLVTVANQRRRGPSRVGLLAVAPAHHRHRRRPRHARPRQRAARPAARAPCASPVPCPARRADGCACGSRPSPPAPAARAPGAAPESPARRASPDEQTAARSAPELALKVLPGHGRNSPHCSGRRTPDTRARRAPQNRRALVPGAVAQSMLTDGMEQLREVVRSSGVSAL